MVHARALIQRLQLTDTLLTREMLRNQLPQAGYIPTWQLGERGKVHGCSQAMLKLTLASRASWCSARCCGWRVYGDPFHVGSGFGRLVWQRGSQQLAFQAAPGLLLPALCLATCGTHVRGPPRGGGVAGREKSSHRCGCFHLHRNAKARRKANFLQRTWNAMVVRVNTDSTDDDDTGGPPLSPVAGGRRLLLAWRLIPHHRCGIPAAAASALVALEAARSHGRNLSKSAYKAVDLEVYLPLSRRPACHSTQPSADPFARSSGGQEPWASRGRGDGSGH
jgi:hypothetical protein